MQKAITTLFNTIYSNIYSGIEFYAPKIVGAIAILGIWILISIGIYRFIVYTFKRLKIVQLLDKLEIDFIDEEEDSKNHKKISFSAKLSKKVKIDEITAKAVAYYVFLVFFRFAIVAIGIKEVEKFLADLLAYLPQLFIAIIIWFFGIRFANFVYDVVYNTLKLTKQKTGKIIANGAKIIILFFTLMIVLNYIQIVDQFIINTIFVGFISMMTLAWGLAFWLGWKDIAAEILESFRK